jgi:F0F1-type ATP synthase membrane subunit b/b'
MEPLAGDPDAWVQATLGRIDQQVADAQKHVEETATLAEDLDQVVGKARSKRDEIKVT